MCGFAFFLQIKFYHEKFKFSCNWNFNMHTQSFVNIVVFLLFLS